jgi:hypothetical protein
MTGRPYAGTVCVVAKWLLDYLLAHHTTVGTG